MVKIGIIGATGRMGAQLVELVTDTAQTELGAAITHSSSTAIGEDAGLFHGLPETGVLFADDVTSAAQAVDVLIDFSLPVALTDNLAAAREHATPIVVCTTGLNEQQHNALHRAAEHCPLLYAANTSLGVNLLIELVRTASRALGDGCDIEVLEAHHRAKRDAPSGTALALGTAAAAGRGQELSDVAEYQRNHQEQPYQPGSIGFATIRGGDIVGEHTVYLVSGGERLELTHRVAQRKTFAEGALNAALWLCQKQPGYYTMKHVLGLDG